MMYATVTPQVLGMGLPPVGFSALLGAVNVLSLGIIALPLLILVVARRGMNRTLSFLLSAMIAVGIVGVLFMFAGPSRRSATTTISARSGIAARSTEKVETHDVDDHGAVTSSATHIDSNVGDEDVGIVISNDGDSHTISLGSRTRRLGSRLRHVGSRMRRLGQRLHTRLDRRIGPNGTRWLVSGSAILALMFVGYVALSATAKGRFPRPLRAILVLAFVSLFTWLAAIR